jgi:nucleoside 2-deoxyribosyltransferase
VFPAPLESEIPVKKKTIYLSGPMENVSMTAMSGWRDRAKEMLAEKFNCIDPVDRKREGVVTLPTDIYKKDLKDMRKSHLILVNLDAINIARHGTAMEMMYFHECLGRPVISFSDELARVQAHPFFLSTTTDWHETLENACLRLNNYWSISK